VRIRRLAWLSLLWKPGGVDRELSTVKKYRRFSFDPLARVCAVPADRLPALRVARKTRARTMGSLRASDRSKKHARSSFEGFFSTL